VALADHSRDVVIGEIFLTLDEKKRVHRGGSFLCNDQYCSRYIVGTVAKARSTPAPIILVFVA
jgi:hypothetical protein